MRFLVYGAGALGFLLSSYLSKVHDVIAVSRERFLEINRFGLHVHGLRNEVFPVKVVASLHDAGRDFDAVILSVKSQDVLHAIEELKKASFSIPIVTLQNGIYAEKVAVEYFSRAGVFPASVMMGAFVEGDYSIYEFMNNGLKIGSLNGLSMHVAKRLHEAFLESGIDSELSDNIMRDKWHKFMFYCSAASLNALTGVKDISSSGLLWLSKVLLDECVSAGECIDPGFDLEELGREVYEFIRSFSPHEWVSSVGYDLKHDRVPTEIDYLNGYIVALGKECGVQTPYNETIYSLIKVLEKTGYLSK